MSSFVGVTLGPLFLARGQPDKLVLKEEKYSRGPRTAPSQPIRLSPPLKSGPAGPAHRTCHHEPQVRVQRAPQGVAGSPPVRSVVPCYMAGAVAAGRGAPAKDRGAGTRARKEAHHRAQLCPQPWAGAARPLGWSRGRPRLCWPPVPQPPAGMTWPLSPPRRSRKAKSRACSHCRGPGLLAQPSAGCQTAIEGSRTHTGLPLAQVVRKET